MGKQSIGVEWVVGAWGDSSRVFGVSLKMGTEGIMVARQAFVHLSN